MLRLQGEFIIANSSYYKIYLVSREEVKCVFLREPGTLCRGVRGVVNLIRVAALYVNIH